MQFIDEASLVYSKDSEIKVPYLIFPLVQIAHSGNVEIVKMPINAGADLNIQNKEGDTALMIAIRC